MRQIAEAIVEPREDSVDGFPERLMPDDYGDRLSDTHVAALAAFVATAAGTEAQGENEDGAGESGGGRGRGRGDSSGRGRGGDED